MMKTSRRTLMARAGLAGVGLALSARTGWSLPAEWMSAAQDADEILPFSDIPANFATTRGDRVLRQDLRDLKRKVTPTDQVFGVQHYNVPSIDPTPWKLETAGLVGQPRSLTLADLKARPRVERTLVYECAGNQASGLHGMVANVTVAGARLTDLLTDARPLAGAKEVIFWAADEGEETLRGAKYTMHFARSIPLDDALKADAILAYEMNGQPLSAAHGQPVRLMVPGWFGVANVKWLTAIELSDRQLENRFMGRDYVTIMGRQVGDRVEYTETSVTRMLVKSTVARVTRDRATGRARIFGVAWTDGTPLARVDVQVDDGAWQPATLDAPSDPHAWTFFTHDVPALASGAHTVVSRATDRRDRTQPASLALKKTYWEDNAQFKRTFTVA